MTDVWLECTNCSATFDLREPKFFGCPKCSTNNKRWPVEVMYDYEAIARRMGRIPYIEARASLWRFSDLLPVRDLKNVVTLDEGGTPLTRIDVSKVPLYVKNETLNPTWSFKDRFNTVNISMARDLGYNKVVSLTSGNAGAAVAAYTSAAGMRSLVICENEVPPHLVHAIQVYGGDVVKVEKLGAQELVVQLVREYGWFPSIQSPVSDVGVPYGVEGYKTIGYEIALQCKDHQPDYIFGPIGSGDGLYGMYKGFKEFVRLGIVNKLPGFCGCQICGADPVVQAYIKGELEQRMIKPFPTKAISIAASISGDHCLAAIYDSGGLAIDVTEEEAFDAVREVARKGILLELSSATSIAGALKAVNKDLLAPESKIVCLVTSAGIKWPEILSTMVPDPPFISSDIGKLKSVVSL